MQTRQIPIVANNAGAIKEIASGNDIWTDTTYDLLSNLHRQYLEQYAALPTNTQFMERGVKESGYVLLDIDARRTKQYSRLHEEESYLRL